LASSPLSPNSSEIPTSFRPFSDRFSSPTKKKWEPESVRVLIGGGKTTQKVLTSCIGL
jgi:hypothetical protein